jgi:hypothetical protein
MLDPNYIPISKDVTRDQIEKFYQPVRSQTDGVGLRVGNKSEFTLVAPVKPGAAALFREHAEKARVEAGYYEGLVATVHDLRVALINNDTQILFCATYSDEFKPYVLDVIKFATPWIDHMFMDIADGYPGLADPSAVDYILKHQVEASVWYGSHEQASVRDLGRGQKVLGLFDELLDAMQGLSWWKLPPEMLS